MSKLMISLGDYLFSIDTATYKELKRSHLYRWQTQERIQKRPALQFLGLGQESIELAGDIYPHYKGGLNQLDRLRNEADQGKPLQLRDGLGRIWGLFVVLEITETQTFFASHGQPLKIAFQIRLAHYGEDGGN